jgi:hypothetical protein
MGDAENDCALVDRIRALEARVTHERAALRDARVATDESEKAVERLRLVVTNLEAQNRELVRELGGVYGGRSWRLTRPLRWFFRVASSSEEIRRVSVSNPADGTLALGFDEGAVRVEEIAAAIREAATRADTDSR